MFVDLGQSINRDPCKIFSNFKRGIRSNEKQFYKKGRQKQQTVKQFRILNTDRKDF